MIKIKYVNGGTRVTETAKIGKTLFLQGKYTRKEAISLLSGKLPNKVKIPLEKYDEGRRGFMTVLGYEVQDVVRATARSQWHIIYKLRRNT